MIHHWRRFLLVSIVSLWMGSVSAHVYPLKDWFALHQEIQRDLSCTHSDLSQSYWMEGHETFNNGDATSLAFFRSAVSLCPLELRYQVDLLNAEAASFTDLTVREENLTKSRRRIRRIQGLLQLAYKGDTDVSIEFPSDWDFTAPLGEGKSSIIVLSASSSSDDKSFMMEMTPILSNLPHLTEVDSNTLQTAVEAGDEEFRLFLDKTGPFVVRHILSEEDTKIASARTDPSFLALRFADVKADFYPQNLRQRPLKNYKRSFDEVVTHWKRPESAFISVDISEGGAYAQWNVPSNRFASLTGLETPLPPVFSEEGVQVSTTGDVELDEFEESSSSDFPIIPEYAGAIHHWMYDLDILFARLCDLAPSETAFYDACAGDMELATRLYSDLSVRLHWFMILMGERSSGMYYHADALPVGSWQLQVSGTKRWILCDPSVKDINPCLTDDSLIDNPPFPDNDTPPACASQCRQTLLHSGDLIYYPPLFGHHTICFDSPTVSLSGTVLGDSELDALITALHKNCLSQTLGNLVMPEMCQVLVMSL